MSLFYGCSVVLSDADFSYSALFLVLGRLLPQHGYYSRTVVLRLLEWKYKSLVSDSQYHSSLFQWRFFFLVKEFIVFLLYFLLFPIVFGRPTSNLISYLKTFFFPFRWLLLFSAVSIMVNPVNASQISPQISSQQSSSSRTVVSKTVHKLTVSLLSVP